MKINLILCVNKPHWLISLNVAGLVLNSYPNVLYKSMVYLIKKTKIYFFNFPPLYVDVGLERSVFVYELVKYFEQKPGSVNSWEVKRRLEHQVSMSCATFQTKAKCLPQCLLVFCFNFN